MNKIQDLRNRAFRYLSRRNHSRHQLQQKLLRYAPTEEVHQTLDELERAGFLNDSEFALERASHLRRNRHLGDFRISADLKSHGINATIISYVLSEVGKRRSQEECLRHLVETWVKNKGKPRTLTQVKKLFDHCQRRGFPSGLIRQSLEDLLQGIEWPG